MCVGVVSDTLTYPVITATCKYLSAGSLEHTKLTYIMFTVYSSYKRECLVHMIIIFFF